MKKLLILFFFSFSILNSHGQGCSDAGFCTMGAMKPDQDYSKKLKFKLRSLEFNYYRGTTTVTPVVYVGTADLNIGLNRKSSVQFKIPYQWTEGNLGSASGMGDFSLSYTRLLKTYSKSALSGTIGTKIPSGNSTEQVEGRVLPMYYQPSLGSFDIVAGASLISGKWLVATGIQIPLTENSNTFAWSEWPTPEVYPDQNYIRQHAVASNLLRGVDVMLRFERNFRFTNFNFSIGALPIYRITKDEILKNGERVKVDKTTGLALSVIGSFGYNFSTKHGLKTIMGIKLTDREVNPDGLTRNEVSSISYVYKF